MKTFNHSTLLLTTLLCLAITSCKKEPSTSALSENLSSVDVQNASSNAAGTFNDQQDIDLTVGYYEINSCTGEQLGIVSGTWHIDVHGVINNNKVSFAQHTNTNNYKLISASGQEYTGSYVSNLKYNLAFYNGLITYTETNSVLLTTPGGGNNSILKFDAHITINANGTLTAFVDNFRSGCQ